MDEDRVGMPRHPHYGVTPEELAKARSEFYHAFGLAMAWWARMESCMFYWFMHAIDRREGLARDSFFSAKGFTGRRDMFNASIPHSPFEPDVRAFLRAASKTARQCSEFRN